MIIDGPSEARTCVPAQRAPPLCLGVRNGRELTARVGSQLTCNSTIPMVDAALSGYGIAYLPDNLVNEHVAEGRLKLVLGDWSPPFPGYHLYCPSRRQISPAMSVIIDALRQR